MPAREIIQLSIEGVMALGLVLLWLRLRTTVTEAVKAEYEKQVESLKAELEKIVSEHQIRFGELHKRRIETLFGTFQRLQSYYSAVMLYVMEFGIDDGSTPEEKRHAVDRSGKELQDFFSSRSISMPKETAKRIRDIMTRLWKEAKKFTVIVQSRAGDERRMAAWQEIDETVRDEISRLIQEVEDEFRRILGDETAQAQDYYENT